MRTMRVLFGAAPLIAAALDCGGATTGTQNPGADASAESGSSSGGASSGGSSGSGSSSGGSSGSSGGSSSGSTSSSGGGSGSSSGGPGPFDAGTFCSGTSPRLMINGMDAGVIDATGKQVILNCCVSAELTVATSMYQALMYVLWRAPATSGSGTIDLGNPPQGFSIEMDLGCDPATASCANGTPEERYTSGFSGTLQYAPSGSALDVSYCLSVTESPSQPHTTIHSMTLYAPNIPSP